MGLYVQQGHGKGSRIQGLLDAGTIEGWVLSPYDESPSSLRDTVRQLHGQRIPSLLDPQTFVHSIERSRTSKLDDHGLALDKFQPSLTARQVQDYVDRSVRLAEDLKVSALLAPSVVQRNFQDIWTGMALQFAGTTSDSFNGESFASAIVHEDALADDWRSTSRWLDQITGIDGITGVYLCPVRREVGAYPYVWQPERLARLLRITHRLRKSGLKVLVGYQDFEGLAAIAAGAFAIASGWAVNRRVFLEERWQPQSGGSPPTVRVFLPSYLSAIRKVDAEVLNDNAKLSRNLPDADRRRVRAVATVTNTQSQIDYLNDLGEVAKQVQKDPRVIDDLLAKARAGIGNLRSSIATLEPVHGQRIDAVIRALSRFRADEGLV